MENIIETGLAETGVYRKFVKEGPKLAEVLQKPIGRESIIASVRQGPETKWKKEERQFTERKGLEDLMGFLDKTVEVAGKVGSQELQEKAMAFKENLVFIGETELQEAVRGLASHLREIAQSGKNVYVYIPGLRSERYIAMRVLEQFNHLVEDGSKLRRNIQLSESAKTVAAKCKPQLENSAIVILDDFAVSGTRIQGFASNIFKALLKEGVDAEQATSIIEANLVASPLRDLSEGDRYSVSARIDNKVREEPLRVYSYFSVRDYKDKKGAWYVFSGISLSGSHSSTDYGFENPLDSFYNFLLEQGEQVDRPLLTHTRRPYELENLPSRNYKDSELQQRWEKVKGEYAIRD